MKNMLSCENIRSALTYIKEKNFTLVVVVFIYLFAFSIGLFYPVGSGTFETDLTRSIHNLSFVNIYLNNIKVAVTMIAGGLIFLGLSTVILLFLNGLILGSATYYSYGANPNLLYTALLPHGIIEVPSFLLAGFVGIRLPFEFYKYLINEELGIDKLLELFHLTIYVFLLLFIAALIESFLVPFILNRVTLNIGGV